VNLDEMVKDSFETMPERLQTSGLDRDFKAVIGFEVGAQLWTVGIPPGSSTRSAISSPSAKTDTS
jgi:hypothetical protein